MNVNIVGTKHHNCTFWLRKGASWMHYIMDFICARSSTGRPGHASSNLHASRFEFIISRSITIQENSSETAVLNHCIEWSFKVLFRTMNKSPGTEWSNRRKWESFLPSKKNFNIIILLNRRHLLRNQIHLAVPFLDLTNGFANFVWQFYKAKTWSSNHLL